MLGYRVVANNRDTTNIPLMQLPPEKYKMSNGYLPHPLDLESIVLSPALIELAELLAENAHNVWASKRISQGWTYGLSKDEDGRRNPLLIPYSRLDENGRNANRVTALESVRTLAGLGFSIVPPAEVDPRDRRNLAKAAVGRSDVRSFRTSKKFAVTSGRWYYEVQAQSADFLHVGWCYPEFLPDPQKGRGVGDDAFSFSFNGELAVKRHNDVAESFGKTVSPGDVIGCLLDLSAPQTQMMFTLNGEPLKDLVGSSVAFAGFAVGNGLIPAISLASGGGAKVNFGKDISSLSYLDNSSAFYSHMHCDIEMWYSSDAEEFVNVELVDSLVLEKPSAYSYLLSRRTAPDTLTGFELFRTNLGVELGKVRGRYFFDVKVLDMYIIRTVRLGWATAKFLPDLAGMRASAGEEEAKLDRVDSATLHLRTSVRVHFPEGVSPNGDAPSTHAIFPKKVEQFNQLSLDKPLLQETDDVLRKAITRHRLWGVGTGDVNGDHEALVRRVHVLEEIKKQLDQNASPAEEMKSMQIRANFKLVIEDVLSQISQADQLVLGCILDMETRTVSFTANGRAIHHPPVVIDLDDKSFLFPLICLQPVGKDLVQIRLDSPDCPPDCRPVAEIIQNGGSKFKQSSSQSRLQLQVLQSASWRPVFSSSLMIARQSHGFRVELGDAGRAHQPFGRHFSMGRSTVAVAIPQERRLIPLAGLVEQPNILNFVAAALRLFCSACASGNAKVIMWAAHLFPNSLLFCAIQMSSLPAFISSVFYEVLVTLYLPAGQIVTENKHFILSIDGEGKIAESNGSSFTPISRVNEAVSQIAKPRKRYGRGLKAQLKATQQFADFPYQELKSYVLKALSGICAQYSAGLPEVIRDTEVVVSLLDICARLIALQEMKDADVHKLLCILDNKAFDGENLSRPPGLLHLELPETVKPPIVKILNHLNNSLLGAHVARVVTFGKFFLDNICQAQAERYNSLPETEQYRCEEFRRDLVEQLRRLLESGEGNASQLMQDFHANIERSFYKGLAEGEEADLAKLSPLPAWVSILFS